MACYKSVAEILNEVFDSSDSVLKTIYKTDDEVLNLVLDESGEPALKVKLSGYIPANNIIDGEVSTYTDLPTASEHTNEIYVVDATIGIPLINRKQAGMYRSDGSAWSLLDVDLQADKVYYSGTLASGNVQDALEEVNAILAGKALATDLTLHLSNTSNPHGVTASQIGAYSKTESDTNYLGKSAQAVDSAKLGGQTPSYYAPASSIPAVPSAATTTPNMDGTANSGSASTWARADHVHPSDTTKAATGQTMYIGTTPIAINRTSASQVLTGITSIDGSAATLTTARTLQTDLTLASAASFNGSANATIGIRGILPVGNGGTGVTSSTGTGSVVLCNSPTLVTPNIGIASGTSFNSITGLSVTTPLVNGSASVGTSTTVARADHVHPTDGLDADMVDGYHAGAASGNIPISNGILSVNLNADMLDGYNAANTTGSIPISNGTVNVDLYAAKSDILATARTIQTNLASTSSTSFNGSANITPGITGTLAVAHGGTGVTTSTGSGSTVLSASPSLTGTPTAPTQANSDNSTKIATTAWVRSAMTTIMSALGFATSLTSNGYLKLPQCLGGLVLQWGNVASIANNSQTAVTFPIAFSTNCWCALATPVGDYSSNNFAEVNSITTTGMLIVRDEVSSIGSAGAAYYFALGV